MMDTHYMMTYCLLQGGMTEILGHSSQGPIDFAVAYRLQGQFYWLYLLVQYDGESLFSEELLGDK